MRRVEPYQRQIQIALEIFDQCLRTDPICLPDLEVVARQASALKFHFQRIFLAVVGETPYDYFNNRRLRIAVERLKSSGDERLIDLALDLG